MYKVIKNAPAPVENRGRPVVYPFATLEPGDAFDVPFGDHSKAHLRAKLNAAVHYHRRKRQPDARFSVRLHGDGFRVHRTA